MEKSCSNCRYGNNCPYGGSWIYCLKDYKFNTVVELCNLFDDLKVRDKIFYECQRNNNHCCEEYQPIDRNVYFTYNDLPSSTSKILAERAWQRQQYYDCNSSSSCTSLIANGRSVLPAGTTIYSMPLSDYNEEYHRIKEEYDVSFLFDDMSIEPAFYSVPRFDIMAIDSEGGYLGMLGDICDLQDGRPVYYIDSKWNTYQVAKNGQDFIQKIDRWKEYLVLTEDMILFSSRSDAEKVFSFIKVTLLEE